MSYTDNDDLKSIASMSELELRAELHDRREAARTSTQRAGTTVSDHRLEFNTWLLESKNLDTADFESFSAEGKSTLKREFGEVQERKKRAAEVRRELPTVKLPPGGASWPVSRRLLYVDLVTLGASDADFIRNHFDPPKKD